MQEDSTPTTSAFYQLTPDRILEAVELLGVRCTGRILQLNSLENRVYQVEYEDGKGGDLYLVAKFYRPERWTKEQIQEEHAFLFELEKEEIPVVTPLTFPDGETVKQIPNTNVWFALSPKRVGRLEDEIKDQQLEILGRYIARLHIVGARETFSSRPTFSADYLGYKNLEFLLKNKLIPVNFEKKIEEIVTSLLKSIEPRLSSLDKIRIHGDFHCGNVLWMQHNCFIVDFDDCLNGPAVQDLWLILPARDEYAKKQREVLVDAYTEIRTFDTSTLKLTEYFRCLRNIAFLAWIGRRWDDPFFQKTFPDYPSESYWQEQLISFYELAEHIQP